MSVIDLVPERGSCRNALRAGIHGSRASEKFDKLLARRRQTRADLRVLIDETRKYVLRIAELVENNFVCTKTDWKGKWKVFHVSEGSNYAITEQLVSQR